MKRGVEGDSGKSEGLTARRLGVGRVVVWCGNWVTVGGIGLVGLGRGGSPLGGIASPGVGRTRFGESQREGSLGVCVCAEGKFWSKTSKTKLGK